MRNEDFSSVLQIADQNEFFQEDLSLSYCLNLLFAYYKRDYYLIGKQITESIK